MLKLYGFCVSNYYNKIKLQLLEKGVAFETVIIEPSQDPELIRHSPLGKVPYLVTEQGPLSESHVISEYLEDAYPAVPLLPADPYARAKCRELVQYIELHLELVARRLYAEAFFGGTVSDETKDEVRKLLSRNAGRLAELVRFDPYVAGDAFTVADCSAWVHFPVIALASKLIYGEDFLGAALGADRIKQYMALIGGREHAQLVNRDRKQAVLARGA